MDVAEPVNRLVEQFKKLPGIGTKSAQRLAFFVLKMDTANATELAESILEVKRSIRRCSVCNNLTDVDPCQFCTHPARSDRTLCIVEEETTALYLSRLIKPLGIRVTRLALGLPVGGDLEYADEVTMAKALEGR